MATSLTIVGLGGSVAQISRSRAALQVALEGAASAGATTELLDLRELELPMYNPDDDEPSPVPKTCPQRNRCVVTSWKPELNSLVQPLLAVSASAAPLAITSASRRCSEVPGSTSICRGFAAAQRAG
jgi:NADPH-dependent FMN reductase